MGRALGNDNSQNTKGYFLNRNSVQCCKQSPRIRQCIQNVVWLSYTIVQPLLVILWRFHGRSWLITCSHSYDITIFLITEWRAVMWRCCMKPSQISISYICMRAAFCRWSSLIAVNGSSVPGRIIYSTRGELHTAQEYSRYSWAELSVTEQLTHSGVWREHLATRCRWRLTSLPFSIANIRYWKWQSWEDDSITPKWTPAVSLPLETQITHMCELCFPMINKHPAK